MGGSLKKYIFSALVVGALALAGCSNDNVGNAPTDQNVTKKNQVSEEEASLDKIDPKEDKKLLQSKTVYYQTPKDQAPKVHKDAENIVKKIAKKKKVNVKPNLNDARYRDFIYNVATDLSSLDKDQQKKVANFAKYVDKYENKLKNKRIQELLAKVKAGKKLTGKERAELDSLLPIKGGRKIAFQKQPTKDQLDKKQPQPQPKPEPNPKGSLNGGEKNGFNPGDRDHHGNRRGGWDGWDHGTHRGSDNRGDGNNRGDDNNNRNNPDQNGNGNQQDQNDQQGNQSGNNQGQQTGGEDNQQPTPQGSYDPIKARDYAYKWWNKRNNEQYGYYSRVMGGCYDCWYDCTNFVSQAIKEGGIKEQRTGGTYWYYSDEKPAYAWGVANSFYKHFQTRAKQVRQLFDLEVGDVVNADFDHDGDIEHSAIVTKVTANDVYVTQHTTDKKDAPLSAWFNAGYDVYGWKMQTANGDN